MMDMFSEAALIWPDIRSFVSNTFDGYKSSLMNMLHRSPGAQIGPSRSNVLSLNSFVALRLSVNILGENVASRVSKRNCDESQGTSGGWMSFMTCARERSCFLGSRMLDSLSSNIQVHVPTNDD